MMPRSLVNFAISIGIIQDLSLHIKFIGYDRLRDTSLLLDSHMRSVRLMLLIRRNRLGYIRVIERAVLLRPIYGGGRRPELIAISPYQEPDDLVFWGRDGKHPLNKTAILGGLRQALVWAGISLGQQRQLNIVFHSHRHFYNSELRGRVDDENLRRATGHRSMIMTDAYDSFRAAHLTWISQEPARGVSDCC